MKKLKIGLLYAGNGVGKEEKIFLKEAKKRNIDLELFDIYKDFDNGFEKRIKECNILYNNSAEEFVIEIIKTIEELGKKVIDNSNAYYYSEDKWISFVKLKEKKIPTPETILLSENLDVAKKELKNFGRWPVVLKRVEGTMGQYVEKANNLEEAEKVINKLWKKGAERLPIIAQEFISSPSYRVMLIDGKIVQSVIKKSNGWKATGNYAKKFEKFLVDSDLKKTLENVIKVCKIKVCGIDLLKKGDKWFILEVNSEPGLDFIEKEHGKLIGLILDYLKKQVKK